MGSFRHWGLRLKILVPVGLAVVVSGLLIATVLVLTSRKLKDEVLPKLRTVEAFRLQAVTLDNACRSYVLTPQEETLQEIETLLARLTDQLDHLRMVEDGKNAMIFEDLANAVDRMKTVSADILNTRDVVSRWVERLDEKDRLVEEASIIYRQGVRSLRQNLDPEALRERRGQMRGQMRGGMQLNKTIGNYLSSIKNYALFPGKEGMIETINKANSSIDKALEYAGTGVPPFEAEFKELLLRLAELRVVVARGFQHNQAMLEQQVSLEQIKKQNTEVFDHLKDVVDRESETVFALGQWLVYGVLLVTLLAVLVIVWLVAGRVGISLRMLIRATERFTLDNLTHRAMVPSQDEVGVMAEAFNQMADHLEGSINAHRKTEEELLRKERLAAVGQLTATVSHELRNPLGSIRTSLAVIEKLTNHDNPMLASSLEIADRNIGRCDRIINDLLDFTRLRKLHFRKTDIDNWLGKVLEEEVFSDEVSVIHRLESEASVEVDRNHFPRALLNVFQNASQAMIGDDKLKKELLVGSRRCSGRLEIYVVDTGPGMDPETLDKVFEPLFSTKSFGVGLGLPTVKQIVEEHGGQITIHSELGQGTEVILSLPLEATET